MQSLKKLIQDRDPNKIKWVQLPIALVCPSLVCNLCISIGFLVVLNIHEYHHLVLNFAVKLAITDRHTQEMTIINTELYGKPAQLCNSSLV